MTDQGKSGKGRKIILGVLVFLLLVITGGAIYLSTLLPIITGYAAKNMGSAVFVQGRAPEEADSIDLNFSFIKFTKSKIDLADSSVTSSFLWGRSKAVYRENFGVTLLRRTREDDLKKVHFPEIPAPCFSKDTVAWPLGDILPDTATGINKETLSVIARNLVRENSYGGNPFAFMVLHKGVPVAEEYDPQFDKNTPFLSWSMAKSVMNGLVGVLVKENGFDIYKPTGLEEWKDDERSKITLNDLMRMQSGLKWNEDYGSRSDVNIMLFCRKDMAEYVRDQEPEFPAGGQWKYSSGSSNVVSYIIRRYLKNDSLYYTFPYTHLFYRIGITDAVLESDPSGTFIGSSYLYATARDYARFALLYMQDGVFNGERILPEGWVKYSIEETKPSNGEYGSLFWLYGEGDVPSAPKDMYSCEGHDGQRIFIMPSKELIVVVLGYSPRGTLDFDRLMRDILGTL